MAWRQSSGRAADDAPARTSASGSALLPNGRALSCRRNLLARASRFIKLGPSRAQDSHTTGASNACYLRCPRFRLVSCEMNCKFLCKYKGRMGLHIFQNRRCSRKSSLPSQQPDRTAEVIRQVITERVKLGRHERQRACDAIKRCVLCSLASVPPVILQNEPKFWLSTSMVREIPFWSDRIECLRRQTAVVMLA